MPALSIHPELIEMALQPRLLALAGSQREEIHSTAHHQWPLGSHDAPSEAIATVILDEIRTSPADSLVLPLPSDDRLKRIARAFLTNPAHERDLEAWARFGAVSSRTLSRRFIAEIGFTFTAWRQRARLLRSLEMLAGDTSVTTIAAELGYSTTSAFIALFRKTFGKTPSRYRLQSTM